MWRLLLGGFLIAHGLVHLAVWMPKPGATEAPPFDPAHSWVLGQASALSVRLAATACVLLVAAGGALFLDLAVWEALAVVGAGASLLVVGLFFTPWLSMAVALNVATLAAVLTGWAAERLAG